MCVVTHRSSKHLDHKLVDMSEKRCVTTDIVAECLHHRVDSRQLYSGQDLVYGINHMNSNIFKDFRVGEWLTISYIIYHNSKYIKKLSTIVNNTSGHHYNTANIEPMGHHLPTLNIFRPTIICSSGRHKAGPRFTKKILRAQ